MSASLQAALIETWTLYSAGVIFIGLRVFSRTRLVGVRGYRLDDYLIWICLVRQVITSLEQYQLTHVHRQHTPAWQLQHTLWVGQVTLLIWPWRRGLPWRRSKDKPDLLAQNGSWSVGTRISHLFGRSSSICCVCISGSSAGFGWKSLSSPPWVWSSPRASRSTYYLQPAVDHFTNSGKYCPTQVVSQEVNTEYLQAG